MSSVPARYDVSGERRKPKPSGSTSSVPSPKMLSPFFACCFSIAKMRSCLRIRFAPSSSIELREVDEFGDVLGFQFGQMHGA